MQVQTPVFEIFYEQKQITRHIKPHLISLSYTDHLSDQSDELQVVFEDAEKKWLGAWFPTQGDKLTLQLGYQGEPLVNLGSFELDEIEWGWTQSGSVVSLKALSTGLTKANRTLKPKAYENTTLAEIVKRVAKRLHLSVTGTVAPIPIKRVTQYQERDVEFLTRLAHEYHHSFKIVGKTLVFTTMKSLEERTPVAAIDLSEVKSLRLRDRISEAAAKVEVVGLNQQAKKPVKATKKRKSKRPTKKRAASSNADTLKIVTRAESQAQMNARAEAAMGENDEQQAGNITLIGNPKLVAGNTIWLTNMGMFSGKYLIKQARHSLSRSSGYTTELEIRLLEFSEEMPNVSKTDHA